MGWPTRTSLSLLEQISISLRLQAVYVSLLLQYQVLLLLLH